MKIINNKKAEEASVAAYIKIVGWIIGFALLMFVFFWYSGLGTTITKILRSFF